MDSIDTEKYIFQKNLLLLFSPVVGNKKSGKD